MAVFVSSTGNFERHRGDYCLILSMGCEKVSAIILYNKVFVFAERHTKGGRGGSGSPLQIKAIQTLYVTRYSGTISPLSAVFLYFIAIVL